MKTFFLQNVACVIKRIMYEIMRFEDEKNTTGTERKVHRYSITYK